MEEPKIRLAKVYKPSKVNEQKLKKYLFAKEKLSEAKKI
jgi:hypothetical protein